jgi:hypothetical protein
MDGIEAAHRIRLGIPRSVSSCCPSTPDAAYAFQLLRDRTAGLAYLLKERVGDLDGLLRALRETIAGRSVIDPVVDPSRGPLNRR